ncbi:MAG: ABC transporter substrate-binding protein [Dehalococcoidia bacterium]|nr:ABC transporter substrate-binding protein [Dehalococcoidia bacterium]
MSRLITSVGVVLLVAILLAGCGGSQLDRAQTSSLATSFPMTVTDHAGRSVIIQKAPETIVSLAPSNTEILYALGLGNKLVAVDDYSDYPAEAATKQKVGYSKPNIETLVALSPDIIFAATIQAKLVVPELEKRGLTVFVLQPGSLEAVLDGILTVGRIMDKSKEADAVTAQLRKRVNEITAKTASARGKPRVFFELTGTLSTAGPGTFVDDLITKAGGTNIAADAKTDWPQLGQEALIARDPEVIILADHGFGETPDKVKARPGWSGISAVKTGRIIGFDPNLTNRPGPRVVDGLELMARAIHPELFP